MPDKRISTAVFIFPNQLFINHPAVLKARSALIFFIEDDLFFGDQRYPLNFHQQKLQLHLASMAYYRDLLQQQQFNVKTIGYSTQRSALEKAFSVARDRGIGQINTLEPVDFILAKRLRKLATDNNIRLELLPNPGFINSPEDNRQYREGKKRWFMADFYQWQRRRLNILLENDQPLGGKWSFDADNRKKIPRQQLNHIPDVPLAEPTPCHQLAVRRLQTEFSHCPGEGSSVIYPVTHKQAEVWLEEFLATRLGQFGPFEDAVVADHHWLYHSVLTPALNTGLLTPRQVIQRTLSYAQDHDVSLSSLEGFVRQIIGWREFMRATYEDLGVAMRNGNHWQHQRKIPQSFYLGTTAITPLDDVINKVLKTGYCHHIERLMVLGGFFFLCEFDPKEVYKWFMEMFIDSYDWVMVPNVFAMSQNADGGLITTKPYFSGSNYILKMSHYKKPATAPGLSANAHWTQVWDGLYWRWIFKHHDALARNPRWAMMCRQAAKMDASKKHRHLQIAEQFLGNLDRP